VTIQGYPGQIGQLYSLPKSIIMLRCLSGNNNRL